MESKITYKIIIAFFIPLLALTQIERWVYRYDGWADEDIAYDVVQGLDGNIYTVGKTLNMGTGTDFMVVSLKDNGDTNWMYIYDGAGYEDMAMSVVYGLDNNIYAAGISGMPSAYWDILVMSLTIDGDTNWTYQYNGPSSTHDAAYAIAYGLDGNIYVAGSSGNDMFVVSLSAAGDTNWTYRYDGAGIASNGASAIAYGADNNIYVAGVSSGAATSWDFCVISLSPAGDTNWTYRYDGGASSYDGANSIVYGLDGNIYAAGYSNGIGGEWLLTVTSLTSAGNENWVYTFRGDLYQLNRANSLVYGADNNIYVAGMCAWASSGHDFTVLSLSTAGDTNWTYRLQGSQDFDDDAKAIAYGSDGNIYVAGTVVDGVSAKDFAVVSLAADGSQNWLYTYTAAPSYWWDEAYAIAYGLDDKIYAAGYSIDSTSIHLWDFTVISLDPATGVEETKTVPGQVVRLEATPNPFTHQTKIRYMIRDPDYTEQKLRSSNFEMRRHTVNIYDATGRVVRSFYHESSIVNRESVVWWNGTDEAGKQLPGGVYFVRFGNEDNSMMEKLLLIR